ANGRQAQCPVVSRLTVPTSTHRRRLKEPRHGRTAPERSSARPGVLSRLLDLIDWPALRSLVCRRAVANGLDAEQLDLVVRQVKEPGQLPRLLDRIARDLENRARYWDDLGLRPRARDHYLNAALWGFYAQLMLADAPEQRARVYARCAESYRHAAPHLEHPAQPLDIPYQAGALKGYLRIPYIEDTFPSGQTDAGSGTDRRSAAADACAFALGGHPCVIILNSFASSKEELHFTESALLNQGMATLSFDYPGVGENAAGHLESLSQEILGNALYLSLAANPAVDAERVALLGFGLGGALALSLSVVFPERYRAVATLCAPYELPLRPMRRFVPSRLPLPLIELGSPEAIAELSAGLSLHGRLDGLTAPLLVAGGGRDPYVRAEDTRRIYEEAASQDKKLLFCPRATHGLYEMMPSLRHEVAQWIKQRL
ncbi:MAG TPA: alpha/beta hydrolase, partial [Candidatus Obscuribacterales bacterium]